MKKSTAAIVVVGVAVFLVGALGLGEFPVAFADTKAETVSKKKIDDEISIRPEEAERLIRQNTDVVIVDVRATGEFDQGAIEGSLNIPFIKILEGNHTLPKDRPILLVCSIGGRSFAAAQILLEKGYTRINSLDGGLADWQKSGMAVRFQGVITQ